MLLTLGGVEAAPLVSSPTWHYDNSRQGANTNETVLTPASVNVNGFGKLFSYALDGHVYAQPLIVTGVSIPGQGTHNVVYVATQHDSVYAFDADSNSGVNGGLFWHTNLGISAATPNSDYGNRYGPYHDIDPEVGITGTPVIDPAGGTMYFDVFTHEGSQYVHRLHVLDISTGAERSYSPVVVTASVPGNGVGSSAGVLPFNPIQHLQRPAMTLVHGILFLVFTGYADTIDEAAISGYAKMASINDQARTLPDRVRSYIDANCAQCHRPGGTGPTFDARYDTPLANEHIINANVLGNLGYDNAHVVTPRDLWRSVLYQRANSTDPLIKMPQLARNLVDTNATAVIAAWINSLPGPALPLLSNRSVTDLTTMTVTNTASDSSPSALLTYQLINAPTGASIDTNGVIVWTPNLAQSPSANPVTTVVSDSAVPPLSATNTFTVVVTGAYDGINLSDPSQAQSDSDGDGLSNLEEYALGTDPHNPADNQKGLTISTGNVSGSHYLFLQYQRRHDPADFPLQYVPEVSGDSLTWYSDGPHVTQVSIVSLNSQFDLVTVRDLTPTTPASPRFIRLRIVQN